MASPFKHAIRDLERQRDFIIETIDRLQSLNGHGAPKRAPAARRAPGERTHMSAKERSIQAKRMADQWKAAKRLGFTGKDALVKAAKAREKGLGPAEIHKAAAVELKRRKVRKTEKRRPMSPATRRKLSAITRKRWKALKAQGRRLNEPKKPMRLGKIEEQAKA